MKHILFVGMSLTIGGAEKSLVNILNLLDYKKYQVDLLLFQKKGELLNQVPANVNFIEASPEQKILYQKAGEAIKEHGFSLQKLRLIFVRYFSSFVEKRKWRQFNQIRVHRWNDFYSKEIPNLNQMYDVAIAYPGGETLYYIVEKVNAKKKITYFHSDYSKIKFDPRMEIPFLKQVDKIVTVSNICKKSLENLYPQFSDKICVEENITSPTMVRNMGAQFKPLEYKNVFNDHKIIVSVGRLMKIKGYDMAITSASILKANKIKFQWFVIGEGEQRSELENIIREFDVEDCFHLIGLKSNPYPYMHYADVLVQTSYFEGKSVVLDEAKILNKPIVVTNYNSVYDQIKHDLTGIIVEMNALSIAKGIQHLLINEELKRTIITNLQKEVDLTDRAIEGFCTRILEGEVYE